MSILNTISGFYVSPARPDVYHAQVVDFEEEAPRFRFVNDRLKEILTPDLVKHMTQKDVAFDLSKAGFKAIEKQKLTHPIFEGWIWKGGGRVRDSFIQNKAGAITNNEYSNLHRILMAERMRGIIETHKLDEIVVPEKRVYEYQKQGPLEERFLVFCKKIDLEEDSIKRLQGMPAERQRKVARQICTLIQRTPFADVRASNLGIEKGSGKIVFFDTEPQGIMQDKKQYVTAVPSTFKKCAKIGLQQLAIEFGDKLPIFKEEAERASVELEKMEERDLRLKEAARGLRPRWLHIVLSLLCPLIPIILLIVAIYKARTK